MHNLGTVIGFETKRTLKKKSFWIMAIAFPVIIAAVFMIVYFSNQATSEAGKNLSKQQFSIAISDQAQLIDPALLKGVGAHTVQDKQAGIADVRDGKVDAFFYYPADISEQSIEVYGREVGIFEDAKYESVAKSLLLSSVSASVPKDVQMILQGKESSTVTYFRDGVSYDPIKQLILPGVFLILFYLLVSFFGSQMLTATTEEKENRVIEMLLTTVEARTLIVGKILALVMMAFLQAIIMAAPILIGYLLFHDKLSLPSVDISSLPVDWGRIITGAVIFVISFLLFTGLLVLVGAMVPTAKEAGQFFGLFMVLIFGPLYAVTLFISAPDSDIVTFLTLFPLTAPIPMLLRNAVGNLTTIEAIVGVLILVVTTIITMALAVRAFRFGALEYSRKLSFKEIFGRR